VTCRRLYREKEEKTMMMAWMMIWMVVGTLLFLALIVAVIWLLVRALRPQRTPMTPPPLMRQEQSPYQQGYQPTGPAPETYQEGDQTYPSPEQPSATYPPAPPQQQE
jgi:hypothetical protein